MRWYLRCALDNLKGVIPDQSLLRDCKRRLIPYKACTGRADATIEEGIQLINFVRSDRDIAGAACLEVGVGWEPLIPFLFSLCGARRVYMTDLNRLCSPQTAASAMEALRRNQDAIACGLGLDAAALTRQLNSAPAGMDELFALFRLEYLAPCNCANLPLADRSLDVVYSRAVLEHVPPAVIEHIFMEARRVLKDSGLMCHFIDPSDHLQHQDRSISERRAEHRPARSGVCEDSETGVEIPRIFAGGPGDGGFLFPGESGYEAVAPAARSTAWRISHVET